MMLAGTPPAMPVPPAQAEREQAALDTIQTLLASMEQSQKMIGQIIQTIVGINKRLEKLEERRPRLVVPGHVAGHG